MVPIFISLLCFVRFYLNFAFKIYRLNYGGCKIEKMPVNINPAIPISQNECQSYAFKAKHWYWDEGTDQNFRNSISSSELQKEIQVYIIQWFAQNPDSHVKRFLVRVRILWTSPCFQTSGFFVRILFLKRSQSPNLKKTKLWICLLIKRVPTKSIYGGMPT